jgi:hypothetical protein
MPLFTVDLGDDTTTEKQLKIGGKSIQFLRFHVVFWPYRTKNSQNIIREGRLLSQCVPSTRAFAPPNDFQATARKLACIVTSEPDFGSRKRK